MAVRIHLEQVRQQELHLDGELPEGTLALNLGGEDTLLAAAGPLTYELTASLADDTLIVHGALQMDFTGECARCLQPFTLPMQLPQWAVALPVKDEDAIETNNDTVDLTPWMREDILLGLPQHPLCGSACEGLVFQQKNPPSDADDGETPSKTWSQLDQWKQPES